MSGECSFDYKPFVGSIEDDNGQTLSGLVLCIVFNQQTPDPRQEARMRCVVAGPFGKAVGSNKFVISPEGQNLLSQQHQKCVVAAVFIPVEKIPTMPSRQVKELAESLNAVLPQLD